MCACLEAQALCANSTCWASWASTGKCDGHSPGFQTFARLLVKSHRSDGVLFLRQSVKNVLLCCRGTNRSGPEHFGCHRARTEVSSEHVHLLPGSLLAYKLHQHRHVRCHHPQSRQSLGWLNHFCNDNAHVRAFSLCGNTAGKCSELSHRRIPSRSGVHSLRVGRVAHILSKRIWRFGRNGRN